MKLSVQKAGTWIRPLIAVGKKQGETPRGVSVEIDSRLRRAFALPNPAICSPHRI